MDGWTTRRPHSSSLEAQFDVRTAVYEIHDAILGGDDETQEEDA